MGQGLDSPCCGCAARRSSARSRFPVVHIDTSYKFKEIYEFRDRIAKEWNLDLRIARNEEALADGMGPKKIDKFACCNALKTTALKQAIATMGLEALLLGIRRDEHGCAAKERYFSPRAQGLHPGTSGRSRRSCGTSTLRWMRRRTDRIHPLLHMTEPGHLALRAGARDIPVNPLYLAKDGHRYRQHRLLAVLHADRLDRRDRGRDRRRARVLARAERAGRAQDKGERLHDAEAARRWGTM